MRRLGLYIHIPFCQKKCAYCDFYSLCHIETKEQEYILALCSHIRAEKDLYKDCEFDTVYMGGGTPSTLSPESLLTLSNCIKECLNLTQGGEFSLEANPGTLTKEKLLAFKKAGVNRLSIGLQSTSNKELNTLGRIHSLDEFAASYHLARECGFDNISVDVMYGLPEQKIEDFAKTLDQVCDFAPEHISAYCLKIEEDTPFGKMKDTLVLPSEDEEYEMYMLLCDTLEKRGYKQYEISNFAKEGKRSRHNMKYWLSCEYVGFGPSAHSYFNGVRYSYPRNIEKYISEAQSGKVERISEETAEPQLKMEQMDEYVMLKLRLADGVDTKEFYQRFGTEFEKEYRGVDTFVKSGHMMYDGERYSFTPKGFFVSNYILTNILHI